LIEKTLAARVLQEAGDTSVPLLDRLRLGIFSNNLDEFFRVRFAAIRRLSLTGITGENILEESQRNN
jgi:polyphosphate kinase